MVNGNHFSVLMLRLHFRNCKRCEMFQPYQLEKSPFLNSCHTVVPEISSISYCTGRKSWHVTCNPIPGVRAGSKCRVMKPLVGACLAITHVETNSDPLTSQGKGREVLSILKMSTVEISTGNSHSTMQGEL